MRIGSISIQRRRDADKAPAPVDDPAVYLENLREVGSILDGVPWLLAGGLSIPITLGAFYRQHRDVDIVVPVEHLPEVEGAMRRAGYRLIQCYKVGYHGSVGLDVQIPVRARSPLVRVRTRRLKFCDPARAGNGRALIASIDVYPYRLVDGCYETCDYGHRIRLLRPLLGAVVHVGDGVRIPCLNLHYIDRLKSLRSGRIHQLDRSMIDVATHAAAAGSGGTAPASGVQPVEREPPVTALA